MRFLTKEMRNWLKGYRYTIKSKSQKLRTNDYTTILRNRLCNAFPELLEDISLILENEGKFEKFEKSAKRFDDFKIGLLKLLLGNIKVEKIIQYIKSEESGYDVDFSIESMSNFIMDLVKIWIENELEGNK